jgi:hypothetical protein
MEFKLDSIDERLTLSNEQQEIIKCELAVTNNIVNEINYTVKANYNTTKKIKKGLKDLLGFGFEHFNASKLKTVVLRWTTGVTKGYYVTDLYAPQS